MIITILVVSFIFGLYMMRRNRWRYDYFYTINYNQMMWHFWIPVGKFFAPVDEWIKEDVQWTSNTA